MVVTFEKQESVVMLSIVKHFTVMLFMMWITTNTSCRVSLCWML